jgi:hypothetical protein
VTLLSAPVQWPPDWSNGVESLMSETVARRNETAWVERTAPGAEADPEMTEANRKPEAVVADAASRDALRRQLDERERRAGERERVADQRDQIADQRDQIANERDRIADVREWQLAQAREPKPGDRPRRRREALKRERNALERAQAHVDRLIARLDRESAEGKRREAQVEHEIARRKLEGDNSGRTR